MPKKLAGSSYQLTKSDLKARDSKRKETETKASRQQYNRVARFVIKFFQLISYMSIKLFQFSSYTNMFGSSYNMKHVREEVKHAAYQMEAIAKDAAFLTEEAIEDEIMRLRDGRRILPKLHKHPRFVPLPDQI